MTVREGLPIIRRRLQEAGIEDFEYESFLLLDWKLHIDRAEFYMNPEREITQEAWEELSEILRKREQRIPLQYLMEECEFMGYSFYVDSRVLVPRQDTECLVELAAAQIRQCRQAGKVKILDLCTGSGCIGLSVAKLCPKTEVTLSDISKDALAVAKINAGRLGVDANLVCGDLFENLHGKFDYILSNPPYVPSGVIDGLMPEVSEYEPRLALDGEADGLAFYRRITERAGDYLNPGGGLFFEIGSEQGDALLQILKENGFSGGKIYKDLAGFDRVAAAKWT